jgi:hypothetical protein
LRGWLVPEVCAAQVEPFVVARIVPLAPLAKQVVAVGHEIAESALAVPEVCVAQPSVWTAHATTGAMQRQAAATTPIAARRNRDRGRIEWVRWWSAMSWYDCVETRASCAAPKGVEKRAQRCTHER